MRIREDTADKLELNRDNLRRGQLSIIFQNYNLIVENLKQLSHEEGEGKSGRYAGSLISCHLIFSII